MAVKCAAATSQLALVSSHLKLDTRNVRVPRLTFLLSTSVATPSLSRGAGNGTVARTGCSKASYGLMVPDY
jgi:hypothetical protein